MDIDFSEQLIVKSAFLPRGHILCNVEDYEIVTQLIDSYLSKQAIDAEIARQSVTDEAVQEAIANLEQLKNSRNVYIDMGQNYAVPMELTYGEYLDLAITALQAYRQPTDTDPVCGDDLTVND